MSRTIHCRWCAKWWGAAKVMRRAGFTPSKRGRDWVRVPAWVSNRAARRKLERAWFDMGGHDSRLPRCYEVRS